jgi:hypothetical protein
MLHFKSLRRRLATRRGRFDMQQSLTVSVLLGVLVLHGGCGGDKSRADATPGPSPGHHDMAASRKEIIAPTVLAAQLAPRHEVETKATFAPHEPIRASLYLTASPYIEMRRISAFLVRDEDIVEEQSIAVGANEQRQEFDFRFAKTPHPAGAYQIRFVEIARSNGKPVLLARLLLNIE